MGIVERGKLFVRGVMLSYGPETFKRRIWNEEYRLNKWHFAEDSRSDCVYPILERYAKNGVILDLGCGSGNTSTEVADSAYSSYVGVDISKEALEKATSRSEANGRASKNRFVCSDFLSFEPTEQFDVILFRESMYHVPMRKIVPMLDKYSHHLKDNGVFIVRLYTMLQDGTAKYRPSKMMSIIEKNNTLVEKYEDKKSRSTVLAVQPKRSGTPRAL